MKEVDVAATGLTGYLGAASLHRMLDAGLRVRLLVRDKGRAKAALRDKIYHNNLELFCITEISSKESIERFVRDARCIVHAAAVADPKQVIERPSEAQSTNIDLTQNLLNAYRSVASDSAFIFVSSLSVYGGNCGFCDSETDPLPNTEYARQKIIFEKKILDRIENSIVLRFGTCVGSIQNVVQMRDDLFFNMIAKHVATRETTIRVFGAMQSRPYVHIDDAGRLLALCAKKLAGGQMMNERCLNVVARNIIKREVGRLVLKAGDKYGVGRVEFYDAAQPEDLRDCSVKPELFEKIGFKLEHKSPELWAIELIDYYSKFRLVAA